MTDKSIILRYITSLVSEYIADLVERGESDYLTDKDARTNCAEWFRFIDEQVQFIYENFYADEALSLDEETANNISYLVGNIIHYKYDDNAERKTYLAKVAFNFDQKLFNPDRVIAGFFEGFNEKIVKTVAYLKEVGLNHLDLPLSSNGMVSFFGPGLITYPIEKYYPPQFRINDEGKVSVFLEQKDGKGWIETKPLTQFSFQSTQEEASNIIPLEEFHIAPNRSVSKHKSKSGEVYFFYNEKGAYFRIYSLDFFTNREWIFETTDENEAELKLAKLLSE